MDKWPYAHSRTSPHIAVCTPAFLANFVKGPNIIEQDLFKNLKQIVLDEVRTFKDLLLFISLFIMIKFSFFHLSLLKDLVRLKILFSSHPIRSIFFFSFEHLFEVSFT